MQTNAKAIVAAIWGGVTGILSGLTVALVGNATLQTLSQAQWLSVIVLGVAGFGGGYGLTWSVTNKPAELSAAQEAAVLDKYTSNQAGGQGNPDVAVTPAAAPSEPNGSAV